MKKIYVADDEENIRLLIQSFLQSEGYEVETFACGEALLDRFVSAPADLIILDVMMPGLDGFNVCAAIRQKSPVPIIIVSAKDAPLERVKGITLGSDDYLVKPFLPLELVARVKALFRRAGLNSTNSYGLTALDYGDLRIDRQLHALYVNKSELSVTPTEYEFLIYMMERGGIAVSKKDLLKDVWKLPDYDINTRTADDLVKRLRKKLLTAGSSVIIETVWGFGFRLILSAQEDSI